MASTWSQEAYIKAYWYAASAHNGQSLPGTDLPYLMHVGMVAMEVIAGLAHEEGLNGDLAVQSALLHDTIEDTRVEYPNIAEVFGHHVADGVLALSKDKMIARDMPEKKDRKKVQMADSLTRILQQPREIWAVKMADRISNLQIPPHYWTAEKIERYRLEAIKIHDTLKDASDYLATRLRLKIEFYPGK